MRSLSACGHRASGRACLWKINFEESYATEMRRTSRKPRSTPQSALVNAPPVQKRFDFAQEIRLRRPAV